MYRPYGERSLDAASDLQFIQFIENNDMNVF